MLLNIRSNHATHLVDALSPRLFVVYLEAVVRYFRFTLKVSMSKLNTTVFADDVDCFLLLVAERVFMAEFLAINVSKTKQTTIAQTPNTSHER